MLGILASEGRDGSRCFRCAHHRMELPVTIPDPRMQVKGRMAHGSEPLFCDHCARILTSGQGEFYIVRIEAVADATPPRIADQDQDVAEIGRQISALFRKIERSVRAGGNGSGLQAGGAVSLQRLLWPLDREPYQELKLLDAGKPTPSGWRAARHERLRTVVRLSFLHHNTPKRRTRSAWLFVGSTPSIVVNNHNAG